MGQHERTALVAREFSRSWSRIRASPGWWPGPHQAACWRLRREAGSAAAAIGSAEFVDALCASLVRWKAFRGTALDRRRVQDALDSAAPLLAPWERVSILRLRGSDVAGLFQLYDAIREIKPTARKWVVTSKTLHHLLPDLIVPMDNFLTAPFLGVASLPVEFSATRLEWAYSAFLDLALGPHGVGAQKLRAAAREVPYPVRGAALRDCRIGLGRVVDFAIAGYAMRHGGPALRTA